VTGHHQGDIPGVKGLSFIDVLPGVAEQNRDALIAIHLENFGTTYPHAAVDIEGTWSKGSAESDIIQHQWLLMLSGNPVGEFIFQTNMRRRIVTRQFLSVNRAARPDLPAGWLSALVEAVAECANRDVADSVREGIQPEGSQLIAMMSEVRPSHVAGWRRLGHISPNIDYREPVHGNHWAEFGEPTFIPMSPNILRLPAGNDVPLSVIASSGVSSFLLDYYRLPATNEVVLEILENCEQLQEDQ
jgi:hypothetical protein